MTKTVDRVTPDQAAKELDMSVDSVRYLLQQGRLPIGYAVIKPNKKRWSYYIYRGLLNQEVERLANGGIRKW